jgi:membrane dipeptidase
VLWPITPIRQYAKELEISEEAVSLCRENHFIDLHLDGFIATRIFGYDLHQHHSNPLGRGLFFGHLDFPRAVEAGLTGAMWSITTNPLRTKQSRYQTLLQNIDRLNAIAAASNDKVRCVKTHAEYLEAERQGSHALFMVIQGGNALIPETGYAHGIPGNEITAVTLIHLTHSFLGASSTPIWRFGNNNLSAAGHELVRSLNEKRIFVDLAHIHPTAFWDVVEAHDSSQPLIDTHTGVAGVRPHWRNLDDAQIKAIADTGGVVGVIFQTGFLRRANGPTTLDMIVEHLDHIIQVAGEDVPALGSDYDGAIIPPPELRDGRAYPRLVQAMLDRGYSDSRIQKILGGNFLRSFAQLRP